MSSFEQWLASPWVWIFGGLVVTAVEILLPGSLLLWLGLSIMGVGLALLLFPGLTFAAQMSLFLVLSGGLLWFGWTVERERRKRAADDDAE